MSIGEFGVPLGRVEGQQALTSQRQNRESLVPTCAYSVASVGYPYLHLQYVDVLLMREDLISHFETSFV